MPQFDRQFPPRFEKDILYPAIYNLDELLMPEYNPPVTVGDISMGAYFNIYFNGNTNPDATPTLRYGKHYFELSFVQGLISPDVYIPGQGYQSAYTAGVDSPLLKQNSKIRFEIKDASGLVIYSDTTPITGQSGASFFGYIWIKKDPLRTYDEITEGSATMRIVGITNTTDRNWRNRFNIRSEKLINIDVGNTDSNTGDFEVYPNISPIVFQNNTGSMGSGSGLFISESHTLIGDDTTEQMNIDPNIPGQSFLHISTSRLETYSGKINNIQVDYWLSGSSPGYPEQVTNSTVDGNWKFLTNKPMEGSNFENEIHEDFAQGLNQTSQEWSTYIPGPYIQKGGFVPNDGTENAIDNKVKFRLKFKNFSGNFAAKTFNGEDFELIYPGVNPLNSGYTDSDSEWLGMTGSTYVQPSSTTNPSDYNPFFQTFSAQFDFNTATVSVSTGGGIKYDENGDISDFDDGQPATEQYPGGGGGGPPN